ncbi:hypothetical protein [Polymorphospora rubra]|uniref:hypothetical protein n=1 Tax=Polymorphospora rubra TaxID=338584 RepID=UPI0033D29AED
MAHVLEVAAPLSSRARSFLAEHARLTVVDPGPDDDKCRAAMSAALGYVDERALTLLRNIQRRYSGLTYHSPFRDSEIVFGPVFEVDADQRQLSFDNAIMDTAPDGCRYGVMRPDGTVWFGLFEAEAQAFPSLDHFLECDALLDHAGRQGLRSTELPADATNGAEIGSAVIARTGHQDCGVTSPDS